MENWDIRYSILNDEKYLLRWLQDTEIKKCFPFSTEKEIYIGARNWAGNFRYKSSLTAVMNKEPCGIATLFLMPYKKVMHHAGLNIIVEKKRQNRGIGKSLLKNILNLAENYLHLEGVEVEIYEGSTLQYLLKKFDFEQLAYQSNFIKENGNYRSRINYQTFFKKK